MSYKICIPLKAKTLDELLVKIKAASPQADMLELWLGELERNEIDFEKIFAIKKSPIFVQYQRRERTGKFPGKC